MVWTTPQLSKKLILVLLWEVEVMLPRMQLISFFWMMISVLSLLVLNKAESCLITWRSLFVMPSVWIWPSFSLFCSSFCSKFQCLFQLFSCLLFVLVLIWLLLFHLPTKMESLISCRECQEILNLTILCQLNWSLSPICKLVVSKSAVVCLPISRSSTTLVFLSPQPASSTTNMDSTLTPMMFTTPMNPTKETPTGVKIHCQANSDGVQPTISCSTTDFSIPPTLPVTGVDADGARPTPTCLNSTESHPSQTSRSVTRLSPFTTLSLLISAPVSPCSGPTLSFARLECFH